jgi:hypothetical protein
MESLPGLLPINDGMFSYDKGWISSEGTFDGEAVSGTAETIGCPGSN